MSAFNISCTVCKELFKDSDSIYTTSCGHVFHYYCLSQWKSRSSICPQCRKYNPETHALYLNFEQGQNYETIIRELKERLKIAEDKVHEKSNELKYSKEKLKNLMETIVEKDKKIDDIQRLYYISEEWRAEFQDKIQKITEENENLKENQSLDTFAEPLPEKDKFDNVTTNKTEDEDKQIILETTAENLKLKETVNIYEALKINLEYKIEMLELRLNHLTLELKQQISKNINHSTDNLNKPILMKEKLKRRNNDKPKQTKTDNLNAIYKSKENLTEIKNLSAKRTHKFELAQPNDCKILMKDFPKNELYVSLKDTIIVVASKMRIDLNSDDILSVSTIDNKMPSNEIALLVEFKTIETKIAFLSHRNRLKSHSSFRFVQVKEYIDEKIYPIFMYANRNLRSNGYEYVCCKDNKVFAKKSINDTDEIAIIDKDHVDRLLGRTHFKHRSGLLNTRNKIKPPLPNSHMRYRPPNYFDTYDFHSPERETFDPFDYFD